MEEFKFRQEKFFAPKRDDEIYAGGLYLQTRETHSVAAAGCRRFQPGEYAEGVTELNKCTKSVTGIAALRSKWAAGKARRRSISEWIRD